MRSHYETLGVDSNASIDDIKKKYRALSLRYHPDLAKTKSTSNVEMFKQISEAYSVLSDKKERKLYDVGGSTDFYSTISPNPVIYRKS